MSRASANLYPSAVGSSIPFQVGVLAHRCTVTLLEMRSNIRPANRVRIDETGDFFRASVLKKLALTSAPINTDQCNWEDLHKELSSPNRDRANILLVGVAHQNWCVVSLLLAAGETPTQEMIESAAESSSAVLRLLLSYKKDKIGYQALLNAVAANKEENVSVLLSDGRAPVVPTTNNQPALLTTAVKKNYPTIVELLLSDPRIDPSGSDNKALFVAASEDNVPMLKKLLEAGANPNVAPSPFVAASLGNLNVVRFLLSQPGVDRSVIPLQYLIQADKRRSVDSKSTSVVKALNSALYGDKIAGMFLALSMAVMKPDSQVVHVFLTGKGMNSKILRHLALEGHSLASSFKWILSLMSSKQLTKKEMEGIRLATTSVLSENELEGNVPLAAFLSLCREITFVELYEDVARKYSESDTIMTCLFLGAHFGLSELLSQGVPPPDESVLALASSYTEDTNFSVLRESN